MAVTKEIVLEVGLKDSTGQGAESAKKRLREMQRALVDLAVAGKESTEEFRKLEAEAGQLSDTIGDVSQRVKNTGSDTKNIEAFTQAIQGVAAGFQIAQGAAALFGSENEDIQKAMLQVNATMAIANGIMQVSTLLQKESAISMTANRIATALYDKTLKGSVVSLGLFRTALISTGIGAAIVAVGLLVENWDKLTAAVRRFLNLPDPAIAAKAREQALLREEAALSNYRDAYERHTDAQIKKEEERDRKQKEASQKRLERLKSENDAIIKFVEDLNLQLYELELDRQAEQEELQIKGMRAEGQRRKNEAELQIRIAENKKRIQKEDNDLILKYAQQSAESLFNFRSSEYDRLSKQAKTAAEDEILALDRQLKNNQITQEFYEQQKATITDKYAKESEKYERKKFENDKVAAIAQALISTYLAGAQVLAQTKGGTIARIIGMTATITAGLAQVATISRQQFRGGTSGKMSATESLSAGGGGSSPQPSEIFANPQMTMLGTDGAAMGQGQGTQPMRAYVVERDITQSTRRVRRLEEFATLGA
jgi:hypothetical protein